MAWRSYMDAQQKDAAAAASSSSGRRTEQDATMVVKYLTDCGRGGHMSRFRRFLLERPDWRVYPSQIWYSDERWKEYLCPLGHKMVDFCDEPKFGRLTMYLKGREWLDEKDKVVEIATGFMPETFIIEAGTWFGAQPPADAEVAVQSPWFVKEADR